MKKCNYCNAYVDEYLAICPLCLKSLKESEAKKNPEYPKYDINQMRQNLKLRFLLFLSIIIISICTLINVLNYNGVPWVLYIISPILYLWLLIRNTLMSKTHYGVRILLQLIGISFFLFVIDTTQGGYSWSVNIVIPFLIIVAIILITIIVYTKQMLWKDYIGYLFVMTFIGFIPILFFAIGIVDTLWPSAVSALYAILTLVGMFILSNKKFKTEFIRRFHI
ncbi:DUF6320 domain-containing protein [Abyssisolibacter fermentans]|uniref:DUF6320 domain-containing protein n=1 Tax=Abyssisolibacter fermentans TaxID=1766203 RepID=UPI00082D86F9|nr:DUF6320 domain-containing protein [Abyssisolibacter fermentans]